MTTARWIMRGFEDFSRGHFVNGGDNLYVNARGVVETIHRYDFNNDGYPDIVIANSQGFKERGATLIYKQRAGEGSDWLPAELPNDSGWLSKVVDIDGDGYLDLVVANAENGVSSELDSYIYWGGPTGLTGERTELPTTGAYDVAVADINGSGHPDLIFPSPWVDLHHPGHDRPMTVYIQKQPRVFCDASKEYNLIGTGVKSLASADLNHNGYPDVVLANNRSGYGPASFSYLYLGTSNGFAAPIKLPVEAPLKVALGDLNNDGWEEIAFCGGNTVRIYWNDRGRFDPDNTTVIERSGTLAVAEIDFVPVGGVNSLAIADTNGDGHNELLLATGSGVEIYRPDNLHQVQTVLDMPNCTALEVYDLNGSGYPDIIAGKHHNDTSTRYESHSVIFWNGPDGFDPSRITRLPTSGVMGCAAGDLDGDGIPEVIFNNTMEGYFRKCPDFPAYIYLGNARGEYSPDARIELPGAGNGSGYAAADLNQNGFPDLVFLGGEGCIIFWGSAKGPSADNYSTFSTQGGKYSIHIADFNRDGWLDLLFFAMTHSISDETMSGTSMIYYGSESGFSVDRTLAVPTFCGGRAHIADVNNDGYLDIIYGDHRGYAAIYLGGPDGFGFDTPWKIPLAGTEQTPIADMTSADLNQNGWLDLIATVKGHVTRGQSGFHILYGGPDGYSPQRTEFHPTDATPTSISVADMNQDGFLDLLVPAYSNGATRELPAFLYYGSGTSFDFENPVRIDCNACCAFMALDVTNNGYPDLLAACHRANVDHRVDSLLFHNGPEGLDQRQPMRLPGMGPHGVCTRDFGNGHNRQPVEYYESPPYAIRVGRPHTLHWKGTAPRNTSLRFQLRWSLSREKLAQTEWEGPGGAGTYYERTGQTITKRYSAGGWLQYRAAFLSTNGCASPQLSEVTIEFQ